MADTAISSTGKIALLKGFHTISKPETYALDKIHVLFDFDKSIICEFAVPEL